MMKDLSKVPSHEDKCRQEGGEELVSLRSLTCVSASLDLGGDMVRQGHRALVDRYAWGL